MRAARGTAKAVSPAPATAEIAWQEWPRMKAGLVLLSTCFNRLTAGILRPDLGILIPSASSTRRPPTCSKAGKSRRTAEVHWRARRCGSQGIAVEEVEQPVIAG